MESSGTRILTERLRIRELEIRDGARIFEYRSRPEVSLFQMWGVQSIEAVEGYIRELSATGTNASGSWHQMGIELRSGSELIGDCGFRVLQDEPRQAEFGIAVAPEYQGHGYAAEALSGLLDYLFVQLGKHRVFGSVDPRNERSVRLMKRVGLRQEAHFVKSLWFKGEWVDDLIFAMRASDWKSGKKEA